jgi:hypothetical protein
MREYSYRDIVYQTNTRYIGYVGSTNKRQMQYGVNDTNERHTAFDLFFSDNTVKDPNKEGLGGYPGSPISPSNRWQERL